MKKLISIALTLLMVMSLIPAASFAASKDYNDTKDHWAEEAIDRWSDYGVVNGKGKQKFDPDGEMTRAEAAQVFANLLGLNKTVSITGYTDLKYNWYKDAIAKCVAAGILNGKGHGHMDPDGTITREEFLTMFARAVCISNGVDVSAAKTELSGKGYKDTNNISNWAVDAVSTLVEKGYVSGVSSDKLAPQDNINRASVMTLLNQSISTYVGKDSTETSVTAKSEGITLIANPSVTKVTGNADVVVVAAGAEKYDAATGEITHNDIKVESMKMPVARVQGENITVTLTINTEAEDAEVTKTGVDSEIVVESTSKVGNLKLSAEGSTATVSGTVKNVTVEETAKNASVETKTGAKIETVENKAENVAVTGSGNVGEVKSSEDVKVETKNTKVENTSETKEIAVTDAKGSETKVENKTEGTTQGETTKTETTVNKQETSGGGGGGAPAHTHTYNDYWSVNETHHWHAASCGHNNKKDETAHTWGTDSDSNKCTVCGYINDSVAMIPGEEGNTYYSSLDAAVAEADSGDVITLLKNVNGYYIQINKSVTLDLNTHTITNVNPTQYTILANTNNVTIKNGTINNSYYYYVNNDKAYSSYGLWIYSGKTTLQNITFNSAGTAINVRSGSTGCFDNVTISNPSYGNAYSVINGGIINADSFSVNSTYIGIQNSGTLILDSSDINSGYIAIYENSENATVNANNSTIKGNWGLYALQGKTADFTNVLFSFKTEAVDISSGIVATLTNCNCLSTEADCSTFSIDASELILNNTIIKAPNGTGVQIWGDNSVLNMNGGSIECDYYGIVGNGSSTTNSNITINGGSITTNQAPIYHPQSGTFTMTSGTIISNDAVMFKSGIINISGGTFNNTLEEPTGRDYCYYGNGQPNYEHCIVIDDCGYPGGVPDVTISTNVICNSKSGNGIQYFYCAEHANGEPGATLHMDSSIYSSVTSFNYKLTENGHTHYFVNIEKAHSFIEENGLNIDDLVPIK